MRSGTRSEHIGTEASRAGRSEGRSDGRPEDGAGLGTYEGRAPAGPAADRTRAGSGAVTEAYAGPAGRQPAVGVEELLRRARARLIRLTPEQAAREQAGGALLVDIRSEMLRRAQGEIPGSLILERNVLEWRLDPLSDSRIEEAADHSLRVVLVCPQGYMSSLAAATLHELGLFRATDLIGGFEAWVAAGLPVTPGPTVPGSYAAASPVTMSLDPARLRLLVDGSPVPLTRLEFRLVSELLRSNGRVVSREELRASIGDWPGSRSRSVDLHVHRIRRKLEPHAATMLTTERGVGFRLRARPA